jgi:hypothetical protein
LLPCPPEDAGRQAEPWIVSRETPKDDDAGSCQIEGAALRRPTPKDSRWHSLTAASDREAQE